MPKYNVTLLATASFQITVEADNEDAALEAAYDEAPGGVCAQCAGWGRPWGFDLSEWDCEDRNDPKFEAVTAAE